MDNPPTADDLEILKISLQIYKLASLSDDNSVLIPCIYYGTHASKPWSVFVRGLQGYPKPDDLDQLDNLIWTENNKHAIDDAASFRRKFHYRSQYYTIFFPIRYGNFFFILSPLLF